MLSRFPVDVEVSLLRPISQPVEAHVHGFGSFLLDSVVDDSLGCAIVSFDGCSGLRVTQFLETLSHGEDFLSIGEMSSQFGFSSGCHDILDDSGKYQYSSIELSSVGVTKEQVASQSASGFRAYKVCGITVTLEYHVTLSIEDGTGWVAGGIVEEVTGSI